MNVKKIPELRIWLSVLILVFAVNCFLFALPFFAKPVSAGSSVSTTGEIEVYDSDGTTPLTSFDLPLFTGGNVGTFTKYFFINNTGAQTVDVAWNVTASSIYWELRAAPYLDTYEHCEAGVMKYSFGIIEDSAAVTDYWHPNQEVISLGVNEGVKLEFEMHYTGQPKTSEIFTITTSFHARQPPAVVATIDFDLETLNLKSKGQWIACHIELPKEYSVSDINLDSIRLNATIPIDHSAPATIGDYDKDGIADLTVRFDRTRITEWLTTLLGKKTSKEQKATFKVTGETMQAAFEGYDTIRIVAK